MITMLLGGLWHGASWKFVVWGGIHGLALSIEKLLNIPKFVTKNKYTRILGVLITFHIVCLCWIFFRAHSFPLAIDMINQIFFFFHGEILMQFINGYPTVLGLILLGFITHFIPRRIEFRTETLVSQSPVIVKAMLLVAVIWIVVQVKSAGIQPFIYFQF